MKICILQIVILFYSSLSFAQQSIDEDTVTIGYVFTSFIVNETGQITNINIIKGIDEKHNKTAVKILNDAPNWNPARNSMGQPASARIVLPIKIVVELQDIEKGKIQLTDLYWQKNKIEWKYFKDSLFTFNKTPFSVLCVVKEIKPDKHLQVKVINVIDTSQLAYPKEKRNEQILELFQMCFDLNEVYARELKKKVASKNYVASSQNLYQLVMLEDLINDESMEEMLEMIEETKLGSNTKKMAKWKKKIAKDLKKLNG